MSRQRTISTRGSTHYIVFEATALRDKHSVNYMEEKDILLHIGLVDIDERLCLVANDFRDGTWGEQVVVGSPDPAVRAVVTVSFGAGDATVRLGNGSTVLFRRREPLPRGLEVHHSDMISVTAAGQAGRSDGSHDRMSHVRARLTNLDVASADGVVDFCAVFEGSELVVLSGWNRRTDLEPLFDRRDALVTLVFDRHEWFLPATLVWHERPDLGAAGVGYLALMRVVDGLPEADDNLIGAEILASSGESVRLSGIAMGGIDNNVKLQWISDIVARARGRDLAQARRLLSQVYNGRDTLGDLPGVEIETDTVVDVPGEGMLIAGWMIDPHDQVVDIRVRVRGRRQSSSNLLERWLRIARQDVADAFRGRYPVADNRLGFCTFANLCAASGDELYFSIGKADGTRAFKTLSPARLTGIPAIRKILSDVKVVADAYDETFDIIGSPIVALHAARLQKPMRTREVRFGEPPAEPRVSIVVPLYGRLDYLLYQQGLFSALDHSRDEFVYVLDQPDRRDEMLSLARSVHARFGCPFRVLLPDENRGFGPASNLGLEASRGRYVCFMNSDVFPGTTDWLDVLVDDLADETVGIASATLLFADGSIQHVGMDFERIPACDDWLFPIHPQKGMRPRPVDPPVRDAPAVTGALMVMRRPLALELGGFDTTYVVGDFEDADLCKRVTEQGLRCVVDSRVRLYHLERQSQGRQSETWRMNLTLLNAWTFRRRWDRRDVG